VGSVQYELKLPAEMVWVHVVLATMTWIVMLWAVAVEGRIGDPQTAEDEEAIATIVAEWSRSVPAS
jgi:cytochrome c oxidase assembly protein subunit 15